MLVIYFTSHAPRDIIQMSKSLTYVLSFYKAILEKKKNTYLFINAYCKYNWKVPKTKNQKKDHMEFYFPWATAVFTSRPISSLLLWQVFPYEK